MENLNKTTTAEAVATTTEALADANGNPTEAQIKQWEASTGRKIKLIEVDGKVIAFSQPTRQIVEAANDILLKTKKVSKYADVILANCQLNFKAEVADDDELYFSVTQNIDQIITSKVASLKN